MASGNWNDEGAQADIKSETMEMGFTTINTDDGTARCLVRSVPSDIIVRLSEGVLHFLQSFRNGPLYVTTIFPQQGRDGKLKAVHSRHEYTAVSLPGFTSRPMQYDGQCEITN